MEVPAVHPQHGAWASRGGQGLRPCWQLAVTALLCAWAPPASEQFFLTSPENRPGGNRLACAVAGLRSGWRHSCPPRPHDRHHRK